MPGNKNLDQKKTKTGIENLSVPENISVLTQKEIVEHLFSDGNVLLTAPGGELGTPRDTQNFLAYFSGGELIISRTHRYDGRVISFLELLKKEKRATKEPYYSDLGLISVIYRYNETKTSGSAARAPLYYDNQMQKDFVDIIARAASMKVSDIHIEVSDQTTIYFRIDGSMQSVLEYNSSWGNPLFVRRLHQQINLILTMPRTNTKAHKKMGEPHYAEPKIYIYQMALWAFVCNLIQLHSAADM